MFSLSSYSGKCYAIEIKLQAGNYSAQSFLQRLQKACEYMVWFPLTLRHVTRSSCSLDFPKDVKNVFMKISSAMVEKLTFSL